MRPDAPCLISHTSWTSALSGSRQAAGGIIRSLSHEPRDARSSVASYPFGRVRIAKGAYMYTLG